MLVIVVVAVLCIFIAQVHSYHRGRKEMAHEMAMQIEKAYQHGRKHGLREAEIAREQHRKFEERLERIKQEHAS